MTINSLHGPDKDDSRWRYLLDFFSNHAKINTGLIILNDIPLGKDLRIDEKRKLLQDPGFVIEYRKLCEEFPEVNLPTIGEIISLLDREESECISAASQLRIRFSRLLQISV